MKIRPRTLAYVVCALSLASCARLKPMYDEPSWKPDQSGESLPTEKPAYSVYFTGSTGGPETLAESPTLGLVKSVLAEADSNAMMVFLGDNVGPAGMPPKEKEKSHASAKAQLDLQLDAVADFPGEIRFLNGDRDWARYRIDGAERQEDYLEDKFGEEIMVPENACGDPQLLELAPGILMIVVNSQWYLADWTKFQEINEGCDAQSRAAFKWRLGNLVKEGRYAHVIVAMHHPIISRGPRGGEHGPKNLFRDGFGGPISNFWRSKIGVEQDVHFPRMQELRDMLEDFFDEHPSVTFISGHEHILQYGRFEGHPVVGAGTGSELDPGKVGQGTVFTAGVPGMAELHYFENGDAWLRVRQADGSPSGKTLLETKLYNLPPLKYDGGYELYETDRDSIDFAIFENYREFGSLYRWMIGDNNRDIYETKIRYPILRLDEYRGGLEVIERGGGGQTNSLRLADSLGREYALRSIRKDPSRLLPAPLRVGPLITMTQDIFFSANPYGAATAAAIAEGVDIPHANPEIYYLPAQPGLGALNEAFADDVYLIEERPADEWISPDGPFGEPDKIDGRDDVLEKVRESYKDEIDQEALVRARLLDLILGDFDRHDDQWRYAEYKDEETGISMWRVIPRDRDQALLRIEGKLLRIANKTLPAVREAQDFDEYQNYPGDFTFQGRMFDRRFLNELTREQWIAAAQDLKARLTDAEIERAFDAWPAAARKGRKDQYIAFLKRRRDDLEDYARKQYAFHAKSVYVVGTDKDDLFEVEREEDGRLIVDIYNLKDGEKDVRFYHREFFPGETKNVQLFGLRDEDQFRVTGRSRGKSIKVRIIPGPEDDRVVTDDRASGLRRRTRLYAWPNEDSVALSRETETHYTRYAKFNQYDYRAVDYDYGLYLPTAGFNVDDGVIVGLTYQRHHYTYHREFVQRLTGTFATSSLGARLTYDFNVLNLMPRLDLGATAIYQTPSFAINFFGLGNETTEIRRQDLADGRAFYRVRQELFGLYPRLTFRHKNHPGALSLFIGGESVQLERDPERLLGQTFSETTPLFERASYLGSGLRYQFTNVDSRSFPRDGIDIYAEASYRRRFEPDQTHITQIEGYVTLYQHLWRGATLAGRLGGGLSQGDYYFYDGQALGASTLRGYRRERFVGDYRAYWNLDYRQALGKVLHSRFGTFLSFDIGRVWLDTQDSDTVHYSYGGGIYIRPLGLASLSAGYFIPEDGSPNVVRVVAGFDF